MNLTIPGQFLLLCGDRKGYFWMHMQDSYKVRREEIEGPHREASATRLVKDERGLWPQLIIVYEDADMKVG